MSKIVGRVGFEMKRYTCEKCTDGTFHIIDAYRDVVVRDKLTIADEPHDIEDDMNARAAIWAMREPTEKMIGAAQKYAETQPPGRVLPFADSVKEWWRLMIEEARNE